MTAVLLLAGALVFPSPSGAQAADGDPIDRFTEAAFDLFLDRQPSASELSSWRSEISSGTPRVSLTRSLARSDEWLGVFTDDLYLAALDRRPDGDGRGFWIEQLRTGHATRTVAASVYGSGEAFAAAGGTNSDYVSALYLRILGRTPDRTGLQFWVDLLGSGKAEEVDVVLGLWFSPEFRENRVRQTYENVLDRAPDLAGLGYWSEKLRSSDEIELAAILAASDEFYFQATGTEPSKSARPTGTSHLGATGYSNADRSYLGNPWFAAGVGNVPLKGDTELSFRFEARQSGIIRSSSFYIVENSSRSGYSSGDCGDLTVELRSDSSGAPSNAVLARAGIADPCAGPRSGQWLTNLDFNYPAAVNAGELYHLVFSNTGENGVNNWVSINTINRPNDDPAQVAFSTGDNAYTALVSGDSGYADSDGGWGRRNSLNNYFPLFEVYYTDGARQGLSYVGTRASNQITVTPGGTVARQLMTANAARTATAVNVRPYVSNDARLQARISRNGSVVTVVDLTESGGWFSATLPNSLQLSAGDEVSVDIIATSGSASFRALYRANHDDWVSNGTSDFSGGHAQISYGSTFTDHRGDELQDLPVYLRTH